MNTIIIIIIIVITITITTTMNHTTGEAEDAVEEIEAVEVVEAAEDTCRTRPHQPNDTTKNITITTTTTKTKKLLGPNKTSISTSQKDNDKSKRERPDRRKERRRKTRSIQRDANMNNNMESDLEQRTEQRIHDICKERFGIVADPRFSVTKNVHHLIDNCHPADLPRQAKNLKVHNLCADPSSINQDLLDTLGLNLNFGISLKPNKKKSLSISKDFDGLLG
jgi:type IV secretory pathway VirB10-like protein